MEEIENKYGLDLHCQMIMDEYNENMPSYLKLLQVVDETLRSETRRNGLYVTAIEARIKAEKSLAGKLELKGYKYNTILDITDIVGARVITFYTDDVDKMSSIVDKVFEVDWAESVDKRKMHELDSFGYNSLHYICRIPKSLFYDPKLPFVNEARFEIQMRTALQHMWSTAEHDTGYKSGIKVPKEYLRNLSRLAGMLELADEQFSQIRTGVNDYRRKVQSLVSDGRFDEVAIDLESYRSFLTMKPFLKLAKKIAAVNQAELHETSFIPYYPIIKDMGMRTLGDIMTFITENSDDAYALAVYEIGATDLDILSSTISIQNLCEVKIMKNGGGIPGLKRMFDMLSGESSYNEERARRIYETAMQLPFMVKLK